MISFNLNVSLRKLRGLALYDVQRPTIENSIDQTKSRVSALDRKAFPASFVPKNRVTISGVAAATELSLPEFKSSVFRPLSYTYITSISVSFGSASEQQCKVVVLVEGEPVASIYIPANVTHATQRFDEVMLTPFQRVTLQIDNVFPEQVGTVSIAINGLSDKEYSGTIELKFRERPEEMIGVVYDIDIVGDDIYLAGDFTVVRGETRNKLAVIDSDGVVGEFAISGTGPNSFIRKVRVQSDGHVIIGGPFTEVSGVASPNIARITPEGDVDEDFVDWLVSVDNRVLDFDLDGADNIFGIGTYEVYGVGKALFKLAPNGEPVTISYGTADPRPWIYLRNIYRTENGNFLVSRFDSASSIYYSLNASSLVLGILQPSTFQGRPHKVGFKTDDLFYAALEAFQLPDRLLSGGITRFDTDILDGDEYPAYETASQFVKSNCREVFVDSNDMVVLAGRRIMDGDEDLGCIVRMDNDFVIDETWELNTFTRNDSNQGQFRTIYTVKELSDGRYLVGGSMETTSDPTRENLVRLNSDGTLDTTFPIM